MNFVEDKSNLHSTIRLSSSTAFVNQFWVLVFLGFVPIQNSQIIENEWGCKENIQDPFIYRFQARALAPAEGSSSWDAMHLFMLLCIKVIILPNTV